MDSSCPPLSNDPNITSIGVRMQKLWRFRILCFRLRSKTCPVVVPVPLAVVPPASVGGSTAGGTTRSTASMVLLSGFLAVPERYRPSTTASHLELNHDGGQR